jgi:hypothetical protein
MKLQITEVLDGDKQKALFLLSKDSGFFDFLPDTLKADIDVIKKIIELDPMRFHTLLAKHRQNIDIQRIALKAIFA